MIYERPICDTCIHALTDKPGARCKAFPDGIPPEILYGGNNHSEPLPDQKNKLVYTPVKK